ncbi:MAG TPA: regulatory iron-sulfur-containing complex subunit RicT [Dehalococcoidia bacterium]|nr:regulatory iron-sulfur-containing complex subunit RicT [Dehalococcoidia bacterium]
MARTVGVRFRQAGKIFYYEAVDFELVVGDYVVVDSAHGLAVGRVVISPDQVIANESSNSTDVKPVLRIATAEDVERAEAMRDRAHEALQMAKEKASEHNLEMSLSSGEFDLDGGQFTAYFTSADRVDFRNLVRDLSRDLGARVQLLQVGDRDRAKLVDGFDICGERLCCSSWMTNFPSVSIRMAKEQDLPLNPQKISGVCGRLYCCLTFEYEDYKALRGTLPKVGSMVSTPAGEAKVNGIDFNREVVKLWLMEAHELVEVAAIDFQLQHGVTIRPMELVRKIEDPLRTISDDRSAQRTRPAPTARSPRPEAPQRGRRGQQGQQQPQEQHPMEQRQTQQRPQRPPKPQPQQQTPVNAQPTATPEGDAAKKRRRRRRRGRGGAAGSGESNTPAGE